MIETVQPSGRSPSRPAVRASRMLPALAAASAMAAGAHELVWARMLGRAVGNTTIGTGLTLAIFMLGSGAGALLAPRSRLWARPARAYAAIELVIAGGAALLFAYCAWAPAPSAIGALEGGLGLAADVIAAGCAALLPALAIGATYPLLVRVAGLTDAVSTLYAAGLGGAVLGTSLAALGLAPIVGLDGVAAVAIAINVVVAAVAWRTLPGGTHAIERAPIERTDGRVLARFAAAGVMGLGAQALWNRCLAPYAGVSTFTFALIVAEYVLAQALAFWVARRMDDARVERFGAACLGASGALVLAGFGALSWWTGLADRDAQPGTWLVSIAATVAVTVGPAAFALGLAQASALRLIQARGGRFEERAAWVTGLGTIASAGGAVLVALVGIPWLGPRGSVVALAIVPIVVLLGAHRRVAIGGAVAVLALAFVAPGPAFFFGPAYDGAPVLYAEHGVQDTTGVITVDLPAEPRIRRLVSNGVSYSGDSIFAQRYMRLLAHLPALAARGDERALIVCVGTGTTLHALRAHPFEAIDAVDISPSIRETLGYFAHVNGEVDRASGVDLVVDDGARYLRRTRETYDVITLEPPPPRAPGGSSLYTREFYLEARARLRDGGSIAQWLPLHGMSGGEARAIVRTFLEVFPSASLHAVERNEAVLIGARGEGASAEVRAARAASPPAAHDLAAIGSAVRDPWLDSLVLDGDELREVIGEGPVLRDAWPLPEYAPFARVGADEPLDAFLERLASRARPQRDTSAAVLVPMLAPFVRIQSGRGSPADRAEVTRAMRAWLSASPSDPYVQHAFGFGPLLEARLDRAGASMTEAELERVRAIFARARAATQVGGE